MKGALAIFFLVLSFCSRGQLTDGFADGDLTVNPAWRGDTGQFKVNSSLQVQLNSSSADTSYLSTACALSTLADIEWRFWIKQSFSPSASNYGRVYLVSDQSDLAGPLNGYYLQFGEALSNDAVELFRQSGTTVTSVCRGRNGEIASSFSIGVFVKRSAAGLWTIGVDTLGGINYQDEASGTDVTFNVSSFFGVLCSYTSSNATRFYFDDFSISYIVRDTIPPAIASIAIVDSVSINVTFSEPLETVPAQWLTNYTVNNGIGHPVSAVQDVTDKSVVHLLFANAFSSGIKNILAVTDVKDKAGNVVNASAWFTYFSVGNIHASDIVINEILAHVKSGGKEFVEIYNRSQKSFDLSQVQITRRDLTTGLLDPAEPLTTATRLFNPGDYLVLTDDPAVVKSQYSTLNPIAFLQMNLPTLVDSEDDIVLLRSDSTIIDEVRYSESWQFPLLNEFDGISLERLNAHRSSQDSTNWHSASERAGFATPGYKNSQSELTISDGSEISIDPEIFSPDNDGHKDMLNIHYSFPDAGNVANIHIYDVRGRLIRNLVNNELCGNTGYFVWDGLTNQNEKARIGMYVIYLEMFTLKGEVKSFKKSCVLGGKL